MTSQEFKAKAIALIDDLKGVCATYGLANDGNEFKIITQVFLYKFLNDKFAREVKRIEPALGKVESWEDALRKKSEEDYDLLLMQLGAGTARLKPSHFLSTLWGKQNDDKFAATFDATLLDVATLNSDIFSVMTNGGQKIVLFDEVTQYVASQRDAFAKAIINKLIPFSFERIFAEKFDFYATLFEYLIKDYNKDGGGKYAEYYTPHAVAKIMAACLVPEEVENVTCYDPAAGSGTLLMNLAHAIGENRCTIYTQDVSQKSSSLLRLNLILNNLVHSIPHVIQGSTILEPYHKDGSRLKKFDYIVCNPPFKLDFSDFRNQLDTKANQQRFFAGIPKIPKKAKDKMAIYLLFLQHIIYSLNESGRAAVVVPTGFLTAQSGIEKKIRQYLVEKKMVGGVVSMPSNIFATTGTNVSVLFIDAMNREDVILIDASTLGEKVKEGKNQKTVLRPEEQQQIIENFNTKKAVDNFSVAVSYEEIKAKNYSLSAGQYFEVKIGHIDITEEEFAQTVAAKKQTLQELFTESRILEREIDEKMEVLRIEKPVTASQFCDRVFDGTHATPKAVAHGKPLVTSKNILGGRLDLSDTYNISLADYEEIQKRSYVSQWDVLFSMIGSVGEVYIERNKEINYAVKNVGVFSCLDQDRAQWLYYFLKSDTAKKIIKNQLTGAVQKFLGLGALRDFPVPEFNKEQLGGIGLLSRMDAKIELNQRINEELEEMAKLLYDYWFVQFDFPITAAQAAAMGKPHLEGKPYRSSGGRIVYNEDLKLEIPETWDAKELSAICENVRDMVDPADVSPTTPYVGLEHVPRRRFFLDAWGSAESVTSLKNRFKKGDVLFGKLRPYFHKVVRAPMEGISTSELLVLRAIDTKFEGFTGSILFSDVFVDFTSKQWGGAQMPRADWNRMKEFKVACPPDELLESFNEKIVPLWDLGASNQKQNHHLTALRDWLLPMLMNGQVTVT
jgi:type I restriction enzyme M protein